MSYTLNQRALWSAVEDYRLSQGLTWAEVYEQVGIDKEVFGRLVVKGSSLTAEEYTSLLRWLDNASPYEFMEDTRA